MLPARATFTYDAVPAVQAAALHAQASRIRKMETGTWATKIEIGKDLLAVKQSDALEHGQFMEWVVAECRLNIRTAQNYMVAAKFAEEKNAAAKSASPDIVQTVLDRTAKGEMVPDREVIDALEEAKRHKHEADRRQKKSTRRAESKKVRERRKAEDQRLKKLRLAADESCRVAALSIIDAIGKDHARFLVDTLGKHLNNRTVIEYLRSEVYGRLRAVDARDPVRLGQAMEGAV